MKTIRFSLSFVYLLFLAFGTLWTSCVTQKKTVSPISPLDEVIDKHLEAIGGKAKLAELKSIRMETNLTVQGMEIPVVTTRVNNVGQRVDISAMGMDGFMIITPTAGWTYMPFLGQAAAEPIPDEQVKESADELDIPGPLFNYKDKGHSVELVGNEKIDSADCYKIKLTTQSGKVRTFYIDQKNYYVVRSVAKAVVMGQAQEITMNYSNYKKTDEGYVFAYSISGAFGQGDMTVSKIEVNKPVDEKIFKASN